MDEYEEQKKKDLEALMSLPSERRQRLIALAASIMMRAPASAWAEDKEKVSAKKSDIRPA